MPTSFEVYNFIVSGTQSINTELSSLTPSTQIFLYEIDFSQIAPSTINFNFNGEQPMNQGVLRIYNDYNIYKIVNNPYGTIKWQGNYYYPFPIQAEGFEYSSAGILPTPKLFISNTSPDQSVNSFYKYVRMQIQSLGEIVGAKFSRIKTFLKYIDGTNFSGGFNPFNPNSGIYEIELPRDIYYIDRKTLENKNNIEYELNSILDIENLILPGRTILAKKCPFQYRGEGCLYEYNSRLTKIHSGIYANIENSPYIIKGLQTAPPVATQNDQLFIGLSGQAVFHTGDSSNRDAIFRLTGSLGNSGLWRENSQYTSGDFVFLQNKDLKFYYVCINKHTSDIFNAPPNINYWTADACGKNIGSCRLRWLKNPAFRPVLWPKDRNGEDLQDTRDRLNRIYDIRERQTLFNTGNFFPRRPGSNDPSSLRSHGIPKDANGNYLNGFLPFGGFPGTNQPQTQ